MQAGDVPVAISFNDRVGKLGLPSGNFNLQSSRSSNSADGDRP
jgi:hypothetical protein